VSDGPKRPTHPTELGIADTPGGRNRLRHGVAIGFATALALVVAGVGTYILYAHFTAPRSFTIIGSITIYGDSSVSSGSSCQGTGGYRDIGPGTAITVSDEAGTLLAKSHLMIGTSGDGSCSLPFEISDVPSGKKFYKVEASHRGEVSYTESEARHGISLQIGEESTQSKPTAPARPTPTTTSEHTTQAIALYPNASGMVYISTKSGATRCQISEFEVDCQGRFQNAPRVDGYPADGVRFTSRGTSEWVSGDLGDIPTVTIDYRKYRAMSWMIDATASGTTFTNATTGHSLFVSIERVSSR